MAMMFKFYRTDKFHRDIELTRKLNPKVQTFEDYVKANRATIDAI